MLLPTTLLRHETPAGPHYDWLIVPPDGLHDPAGALWTARVDHHWNDWDQLGRLSLTPLPPHRRRYLNWQGTLTGGRGHVYTAARATLHPRRWTSTRIDLLLYRPEALAIALRLDRISATHWRAAVGER